ncbi:MAG: glycerol-3-phosphate 1-O-acyltransferase PlsY [Lachnospiraceae bacterium]|nr:glycerol-3-phosphate 1-O-acyltransferase PlsY [Lachnospiraceae bacterium]
MPVKIILCLIVGYICGNFQTAFFIGKAHGIDIRRYGSGNAGTTNAMRTLGRKSGSLVFIGDLLKVLIPGLLLRLCIFPDEPYVILLCEVLGFGAVIGHCYPFWMQFHGGKGIAVTAGAMLCVDWRLIVFALAFALIVYLTRYVSVGSLFVVVLFPTYMAIVYHGHEYYGWMVAVACLYTLSGVFMHRANIKRLINGTENKIGHHVAVAETAETAAETAADAVAAANETVKNNPKGEI